MAPSVAAVAAVGAALLEARPGRGGISPRRTPWRTAALRAAAAGARVPVAVVAVAAGAALTATARRAASTSAATARAAGERPDLCLRSTGAARVLCVAIISCWRAEGTEGLWGGSEPTPATLGHAQARAAEARRRRRRQLGHRHGRQVSACSQHFPTSASLPAPSAARRLLHSPPACCARNGRRVDVEVANAEPAPADGAPAPAEGAPAADAPAAEAPAPEPEPEKVRRHLLAPLSAARDAAAPASRPACSRRPRSAALLELHREIGRPARSPPRRPGRMAAAAAARLPCRKRRGSPAPLRWTWS